MEGKRLSIQSDKPVGIASDHAGYEMKRYIIDLFEKENIPYKDFGTYSADSVDYPDFAHPLAKAIESGECYPGVALCGTGNGTNIALNRHKGVRSALCWMEEIARLARAHNDANIITLPARFVSENEIIDMLYAFFTTDFEGGRHQKRIEKIEV